MKNLSTEIRNPFCGERETLEEAFNYFFKVMRSVNDADRAAVVAAVGVLLNTIANDMEDE
jgi:hypothetical protein